MRHPAPVLPLLLLAASAGIAADTVSPGDNLVVEGVPPIPIALAEDVARYAEFRAASFLDWHPTRREMIIATRFGDTAQVHHVAQPLGARRQLTFFKDPVTSATLDPRNGRSVVFSKSSGGDEQFQLHRLDLADGALTLLTDGKSRNRGGVWSTAGDQIAYTSTRRNGADLDIYVTRPSEPRSERLLAQLQGGGWAVLDWSPDNRTLLVRDYISINESSLWLIDTRNGEKRAMRPEGADGKVSFGDGLFSRDGKGVFLTTDQGSEFQRLAYVDLQSRRPRFLSSHISWDVDEFDLSPDGKTIAAITNEDGVGVLRLFEALSGKELRRPQLPAGSVSGVKWHPRTGELGFQIVSARSPSDVYSLQPRSGKVERWTHSETGGLNTERFPEPELVRWTSFDSRSISGSLYRPPARFTGKRPVIINIHGGPESQARAGFLARNNYYLNELGVAILLPSIRGSAGYGKTFRELDNGVRREGAYRDIGALLDWIGARPDLDPNRVMVTGGSYGGLMTLMVATMYPERIRCAVSSVRPSNLVTLLLSTAAYRRDLRRAEYGDERIPEVRAWMERTAPLNNVGKIRKPLFVVQGANDPRVPRSESEQMVAAARKNGTPVWYLLAKDEGHGFSKKANADFQFYATVRFVQEHLLK